MSSAYQIDLLTNLSPAKRALLVQALSEEKSRTTALTRIPKRTQKGPVPLSYAQRRLWFLSQLNSDPAVYNMAAAVRLRGSLDTEALRFALYRIVERHESLRTSFLNGAHGEPAQVVSDNASLDLNVVDLGDAGNCEEHVRAELSQMAR